MRQNKGISVILAAAISLSSTVTGAQEPAASTSTKYKLVVVENASKARRLKKNRVSSEAVVKVTDENDVPVAGIAVTFTIPQFAGGAAFSNGAFASMVTTNAAGVASSGSLVASTTSGAFSMSVSAAVPGGALSASVPVNAAAIASAASAGSGGAAAGAGGGAAGGGTGMSAGLIAGIVAGVAAAGVGVAVGVSKGGGGNGTPTSPPPANPRATIGVGGGGPVLGPPR